MVKKTIILLVLYFLFNFTLIVCGERYILRNLTKSQEAEPFFLPLGAEAARKIYQEPEPLGKTIRSQSRLIKKSGAGAGAAKKLAGSPALHIMIIYHTPPSPLSRHIYYMYEQYLIYSAMYIVYKYILIRHFLNFFFLKII